MKIQSLKEFFKTKKGACILTGALTFIVTCGFVSDEGQVSDLKSEVSSLQAQLSEKEDMVETLSGNVKNLNSKLEEAKPYFEMKKEEQLKLEEENKKADEERKKTELESKSVELENGNYVAGVDFEAGVYDIVAIEGRGNVISDNMYSGGINAIMSPSGGDHYDKEYKNIKLPKGTTLKLMKVKVRLVPKA